MPNRGGREWVIIVVVALIVFGRAELASFGDDAGNRPAPWAERNADLRWSSVSRPRTECPRQGFRRSTSGWLR
ncbi:twin-arginine translocase TatA/TatE family subunit [Micropruina sp.]|uniref:twin-arginine translocase TatA/TatE family subunit n=1 Tax=Micropruina sp. TaxID=2737536 RepID=UPI0039E2C9A1